MFDMNWPRARTVLLAACVTGFLTGCAGVNAVPDVTNAPAPGFAKFQTGSEEDFILNVGRRTFFVESSADLDDTGKVTLDKQADWLNKHKRWKVKIQGFSDDPGSPEQNVALSQRRADAVRDYLASKGVDKNRMWTKGYGKERIVRDCPELACKSQNRRVITNLREEFDESAPQAGT